MPKRSGSAAAPAAARARQEITIGSPALIRPGGAHPRLEPVGDAGLAQPAAEIFEEPFLGALPVGPEIDGIPVRLQQRDRRAIGGALVARRKGPGAGDRDEQRGRQRREILVHEIDPDVPRPAHRDFERRAVDERVRLAGFGDDRPIERDDRVERNPARLAGHAGEILAEPRRDRRQRGDVDAACRGAAISATGIGALAHAGTAPTPAPSGCRCGNGRRPAPAPPSTRPRRHRHRRVVRRRPGERDVVIGDAARLGEFAGLGGRQLARVSHHRGDC